MLASLSATYLYLKSTDLVGLDLLNPPVQYLRPIHCSDPLRSCAPLLVYDPNDPYHASIISTLAHDLGLNLGCDVVGFAAKDKVSETLLVDQVTLLEDRPTLFGIQFNTFSAFHPSGNLTALFHETPTTYFTLLPVNKWSRREAWPDLAEDISTLRVKHYLENAVLRTKAKYTNRPIPELRIGFAAWPRPTLETTWLHQSSPIPDDKLTLYGNFLCGIFLFVAMLFLMSFF
jgi:hypothetical protein